MRRECKIPRAELERRLAAGQTYRRIAMETGWSESAVARRCVGLRLPAPRGGRMGADPLVSDDVLRELLVTEVRLSLRAIGHRVGISDTAVHKRARRLGIPTHRAGRAAFAMQVAA